MKKFLVTGGSGFIGSNLVKFLLKKNYFVINLDKLSYSANPYNLKKITKNKKYKFFKADINDQVLIYKILSRFKPNGIFNLAAETHVDRSIDNPKNFIYANILGVYNLIEALRKFSNCDTPLIPICETISTTTLNASGWISISPKICLASSVALEKSRS